MECSCTVGDDYDGDEGMKWGVREVMRAGKDHKCCECREIIKKGSPYFYHTLFGDSHIENMKICNDCQSVIWQFFSSGWMFETIWDTLGDYICYNWESDLPSDCISKLSPGARDKVCDLIEKVWRQIGKENS